jgi:hypothetical protein
VRRADFEHVLGAAANVTGLDEFVVVGSQAILGSFVDVPESLLRSLEADIYPLRAPGAADLIDGPWATDRSSSLRTAITRIVSDPKPRRHPPDGRAD